MTQQQPANDPLTRWKCDVCGKQIIGAENGYMVFDRDENGSAFGFQIIHHRVCDDSSRPSSLALDTLLGPDGLARLTAFLSAGEMHLAREGDRNTGEDMRVRDMDDFVDLFRRLQLPYYEEARAHFADPDFWDDHDGYHTSSVYFQETLQRAALRDDGERED